MHHDLSQPLSHSSWGKSVYESSTYYQGQTRYNIFLDSKPLNNTYHLSAQCSSRSSSMPKKLELRTWNLGQTFKISCPCRSLHGFQALHFMWHWFRCKFWLLPIQNHARDCLQATVHCHLKLLCYSIGIWADTLFLDRWFIFIFSYALGQRFAAAVLPLLFWTNPRSLHKGATGSYIHSETNECSKDWAKGSAQLWHLASYCKLHWKLHFTY